MILFEGCFQSLVSNLEASAVQRQRKPEAAEEEGAVDEDHRRIRALLRQQPQIEPVIMLAAVRHGVYDL